jgi:uncharacterized protein YecE (DUF72 family)
MLKTEYIIGTSGWMYRDWNDKFYPADVKGKKQLAYFATQFSTVEINSTFYHMPRESSVQNWYDTVPEDFVFAIKLNRYLTHTKRLLCDEDFQASLLQFFTSIAHLKEKLGVVLVQLPPSMRSDNLPRIAEFAVAVKQMERQFDLKIPLAIEFRHASWFTEETRELLRSLHIAQVIIDSPGRWPADKSITTDFSYIRFHGSTKLYSSSYTDEELDSWVQFIQEAGQGCKQVFAYFNNDFGAVAIPNARDLRQKLTA